MSLAALLAGLLLAGCGGSSKSASPTPNFTAKANAICAASAAKASGIPKPAASSGLPGLAAYLQQFLAIGEQNIAQLKALTPPSSQSAAYNAYVAMLQQDVPLFQPLIAAARANNISQVRTLLARLEVAAAAANSRARAIGLTACASSSATGAGANGASGASGAAP